MSGIKRQPKVDKKATRAAVEQRLEQVKLYRQFGAMRREIRLTSSPEPRYHSPTNVTGKPVEDVAVHNVDAEERLRRQYEQVEQVVSRLGNLEREIIERRFLDDELYDYQIMMDLDIRESTYYRLKAAALFKLAYALCLEQSVE